jgi:hypothetical protein
MARQRPKQACLLLLLGGALLLIATGCGSGHAAAPPHPATSIAQPSGTGTPEAESPARPRLRQLRAIASKFSVVDLQLEEGVRAVSGLDPHVRCWTPANWETLEKTLGIRANSFFGITDPFTYDIHLHGYVCDWIHALMDGRRFEDDDDAFAAARWLVLLTHEGEHLTSAGPNERLAECWVMQDADRVGAALGIDQTYAQELSNLYWEKIYPLETESYRTPDCWSGGIMDHSPGDTWP